MNFYSSASAPYRCIQQQTICNMHPELFFLLFTVILGQSKKGLSTYPIGLYNFLRIEKYANVGCDNYLKCRYKFFTKNKNQKTSYSNLTTLGCLSPGRNAQTTTAEMFYSPVGFLQYYNSHHILCSYSILTQCTFIHTSYTQAWK